MPFGRVVGGREPRAAVPAYAPNLGRARSVCAGAAAPPGHAARRTSSRLSTYWRATGRHPRGHRAESADVFAGDDALDAAHRRRLQALPAACLEIVPRHTAMWIGRATRQWRPRHALISQYLAAAGGGADGEDGEDGQ